MVVRTGLACFRTSSLIASSASSSSALPMKSAAHHHLRIGFPPSTHSKIGNFPSSRSGARHASGKSMDRGHGIFVSRNSTGPAFGSRMETRLILFEGQVIHAVKR